MRRGRTRLLIGLAVFLAAAAAGYVVAPDISLETLRIETEERLAEAMGAPVTIGTLRVSLGLGIRLDGSDVETWPTASGASLRAERAIVELRPLAHLTGQHRLRSILLDRAILRIERDAGGGWSPPAIASLAEREREPNTHPAEALLSPLTALETMARTLLEGPLLADRLVLRDARVEFVDRGTRGATPSAQPVTLVLEGLSGRLQHRWLPGDTRLQLRARLADGRRERGLIEIEGNRARDGSIRLAVATTSLELAAVAPYLGGVHPDAQLEGRLSGAAIYETPSPGTGRLEMDLVGFEMASGVPPEAAARLSPLEAERVELHGVLAISPRGVGIRNARFASPDLELEIDGNVERPLRESSTTQITLMTRGLEVDQVRHLIGWLPEIEREEAATIVGQIESGRVALMRSGGTATFTHWQDFLAGRTRDLPSDFVLDVELVDTVLKVGPEDQLENLSGRLWWTGDHVEVRNGRATLNGDPLPTLDLSLEGVSNFFGVDPARREFQRGGPPLVGLKPFWEFLSADSEKTESQGIQTTLRLDLDNLHHPMFLWPIEDIEAAVEPVEGGLHIVASRGTWAGTPIRGDADWLFEPDERVSVRLSTAPASPAEPEAPAEQNGWLRGRFYVGEIREGLWRQRNATGRLVASDAKIRFEDTIVDLDPMGRITASGSLDLSAHEDVPFRLSFALEGGDVSAIAEQVTLPREVATGRLDLAGSFEGRLVPGSSVFADLDGLLELVARDGTIRRALPAVVAIALASESFNPFTRRETVRYDRSETLLEFGGGTMHTDALSVVGPDLRVFASGELKIADEPNQVDAEVALFLFRQIDNVLDKIPLLNLLLLGSDESLVAAHFTLRGDWNDPEAKLVPLRSFASGPAGIVLEAIPFFLRKGIEAIEGMLGGRGRGRHERLSPAPPPAPTPKES